MYNTLLDILNIQTIPESLTLKNRDKQPNLEKIKGAEILLVDDNTINQEVAREFLEKVGMVVTIASNGQECLDALQRETLTLC